MQRHAKINPSGGSIGKLPNLLVIGAQKCGTTSLHYYLSQHPEIYMSRRKELKFFNEASNWHKGIDWYRAQFRSSRRVRGEASSSYTKYPYYKGVPEKIASVIPETKLIYILRDPINRIVSHYIHEQEMDRETRPFEEAVFAENSEYIAYSKYFLQIMRYEPFFDDKNILITSSETLRQSTIETMSMIFRFLEVDDTFNSSKFELGLHSSAEKRVKTRFGKCLAGSWIMKKLFKHGLSERARRVVYRPFSVPIKAPVVSAETRERLVWELAPDVEALRKHSGQTFSQWSL